MGILVGKESKKSWIYYPHKIEWQNDRAPNWPALKMKKKKSELLQQILKQIMDLEN